MLKYNSSYSIIKVIVHFLDLGFHINTYPTACFRQKYYGYSRPIKTFINEIYIHSIDLICNEMLMFE